MPVIQSGTVVVDEGAYSLNRMGKQMFSAISSLGTFAVIAQVLLRLKSDYAISIRASTIVS
jgi:hypothetical protein